MDTAEIFVVVVGLTLIAATAWFFFGARDDETHPKSDKPLYACPMHPWITSDDPAANCSVCGMKLVRAEEAKTEEPHAVSSNYH